MLAEWKVKEKRIAKHSAEEQSSALFSFINSCDIIDTDIIKGFLFDGAGKKGR